MQCWRRKLVLVGLACCLVLMAAVPASASPVTISKIHHAVALDDLGFTVEVPDNAFGSTFQVEPLPVDAAKVPPAGNFYITRIVNLNVIAYAQPLNCLLKPMRLSFKFDMVDFKRAAKMDTGQPLGRFRIGMWNESTQNWQELPSTIFWNGSNGVVEASSIFGNGKYALLWSYAPGAQMSTMGGSKIRLLVNYDEQILAAEPFVQNGRTMVPLIFAGNMGFTISWDDKEKRISMSKGTTNLKLWIGNYQVEKNGVPSTIDAAPVISDGRTYVPMSFIAQALGAEVSWDPLERTARILYQ